MADDEASADEPTDFAPSLPPESPPPPRSDPGIFGEDERSYSAAAPPTGDRSRAADLGGIGVLIPALLMLPVAFAICYPLFRLAEWKVDLPPYPVCFAAYVAVGLVTLARPLQKALLSLMFGAREPTPAEWDKLGPAWHAVLRHAFVGQEEYDLVLVDSHGLNSPATGGSVVVVTTGAIEELPPDELQAVLAHELGHHFGLQDIALPLAHWLSLPVAMLNAVNRVISQWGCFLAILLLALWAASVQALDTEVASVLLLGGLVYFGFARNSMMLGMLVGRFSEYAADRTAVELGYGNPLAAAIGRHERLGQLDADMSTSAYVFGPAVPLQRRLGRIKARIARQHRGELPQ